MVSLISGAAQSDHSSVSFVLEMQEGARPMHYHPDRPQSRHEGGGASPNAASSSAAAAPAIRIPPAQLSLPARREPPSDVIAQLAQKLRKVGRGFPSGQRPVLTEIYLCHFCSDHQT
eukprot:COSAG01_NODE_1017_length_12107_cov_114.566372_2_plen_117_part_00